MSAPVRDLAAPEHWERSSERSLRLRALAPQIRKRESRKKRASLVVTAAMASAPVLPGLAMASSGGGKKRTDIEKLLRRHQGDRVLLAFGMTDGSVAQVQRTLHIPDDGIYGPQTEAAVALYQKHTGLDQTGKVDVRTWLKLFPNDTVVYWPGTTGGGSGQATAASAGSGGTVTDAVLQSPRRRQPRQRPARLAPRSTRRRPRTAGVTRARLRPLTR